MTLAELRALPPGFRWSSGRKEALVRAIQKAELTVAEACAEFDLGAEEVASWIQRFRAHGRPGLEIYKLQATRP